MPTIPAKLKVLAVLVVVWYVRYKYGKGGRKVELRLKAKEARRIRDKAREDAKAKLPRFEDVVGGVEIIAMTVVELLKAMEQGQYTSEQIVTAFCSRALQAGEELDCNAEEMFLAAVAEARKCDAERASGHLRGVLHGIPISVKDQLHMEGLLSTCGLACRADARMGYTSALVSVLVSHGAIPFVRSNVPQALMLPESGNRIWGTAKNPYDTTRTPGGSSGGEGALIACGASPLGLGTDIGGSVRIPAAFCGVVGFKPTAQRVTSHGVGVPRPRDATGQNAVFGNAGPLGKTVGDVELVMKLWNTPPVWAADPSVPPMPWDAGKAEPTADITFGVLMSDGFFTPAPSYTRALETVVGALQRQGYTVKPITFDLSQHAELYLGLLGAEGSMRGIVDGLEGEPLHRDYKFVHMVSSIPNTLRTLLGYFMGGREKQLLAAGRQKDTYEFWEWVKRRDALRKGFMQYLLKEGITAVLCPGMGLPALKHGASSKLSMACSYTFLWNNFHFPAGSVPVTRVQRDETAYLPLHSDRLDAEAAADLTTTVGLPVNVQVVSLPFRDEHCIAAMKVVEAAAKPSWTPPSYDPKTAKL